MTPLKTPIVLRIETAEEALCVWHRLNVPLNVSIENWASEHYPQTHQYIGHAGNVWRQFFPMAVENGLSISKALPQPLLIGTHKVEPLPDGSIKVGCTTVTRATLLKVLELSDAEVKKGAVSEWPKFMRHPKDREGILEFHQDHKKSLWHSTDGEKIEILIYRNTDEAKARGWFPITPAEASAILKGAK